MAKPSQVNCVTLEFLRFDGEAILGRGNRYIRTAGYDKTVTDIQPGLSQRDFVINLGRLRYRRGQPPEQVEAARNFLAGHTTVFIPDGLRDRLSGLVQIDIVTQAAELWAFPFEAWLARHPQELEHPDQGIVITRRIRGEFSTDIPPWPEMPSVLFVHAPRAGDLEQELIDQHQQALALALAPWAAGGDPVGKGLLTVREVRSEGDFRAAVRGARYSFIHILAHGAPVPAEAPEDRVWGLRLGSAAASPTHPATIAEALRPLEGNPLVVTLAVCDSGNAGDPAMGNYSAVQELHRSGIPVVVGSQLPLTKPGSVEFARDFYVPLLAGRDVRAALHAGRLAVRRCTQAGHDWLSVVAYVRLPPEGYARHLLKFSMRAELGILKALQSQADELSICGGTEQQFGQIEDLLNQRIMSLQTQLSALQEEPAALQEELTALRQECGGLLASAHKRRAELLYTRAGHFPARREEDLQASRTALEYALQAYRQTFRLLPQSHWNGMQQLALEAVLHGRFANPRDWDLVRAFAEHVRDHDSEEFWSCGTLIEAYFIAPIACRPYDLEAIRAEIATLRRRVGNGHFAIESTRRQMQRFASWWTKANGFFPNADNDLSAQASQVAAMLSAAVDP